MKYKAVKDNGTWGCLDCVNALSKRSVESDTCAKFMEDNNLVDCNTYQCHFIEVDETLDIETDAMGNCYSDADPGL